MRQAAVHTPSNVERAISPDGTAIAYERAGEGPSVVLVAGAAVDRRANAPLLGELARDFTVFSYDRRGRGESGDTPPYAVDREIEDVAAMLEAAGGRAHVLGASSGAVLAFLAAARGLPITRLVLWEPPFMTDASMRPPADAAATLDELARTGRRSDAVAYFLSKVVGMPPEAVESARAGPEWAAKERLAHTLSYDDRVLGDYAIPHAAAAQIQAPTLILTGGRSVPFFRDTAKVLEAAIPNARAEVLDGMEHVPHAARLAPVVREFLA
jgi:pimeloyl-ACP methyl ester carboxylesterase